MEGKGLESKAKLHTDRNRINLLIYNIVSAGRNHIAVVSMNLPGAVDDEISPEDVGGGSAISVEDWYRGLLPPLMFCTEW
nr:hypothetical protein BgiMline_030520 [Biomphalaria glabrata]